jgi:hypothetical protein
MVVQIRLGHLLDLEFLLQFDALDVPVFLCVILDCAVGTKLAHLLIQ